MGNRHLQLGAGAHEKLVHDAVFASCFTKLEFANCTIDFFEADIVVEIILEDLYLSTVLTFKWDECKVETVSCVHDQARRAINLGSWKSL